MKEFIALPVGQGDAFYLKHDNFSVLIDGGKSRKRLSSLFRKHTNTNGVNVLVCTHNDADHANGVLGFLESDLNCDEVWLPGRWLSVLPDLLKPFEEIHNTLINDMGSINKEVNIGQNEIEQYVDFGEYADEISSELSEDSIDSAESIPKNGWPEQYRDNHLKSAKSWDSFYDYLNFIKLRCISLEEPEYYFFWSAIEAAIRIRKIADSAIHSGIPVRWFQYDTKKPSKSHPILKSINARQISNITPRNKKFSLMQHLALTVSNKESLVFWSPQTDSCPGILFTADSDLKNTKLPKGHEFRSAIVTAPHHGSEANAHAYTEVKNAAGNNYYPSITWIRSDGKYKQRPGKSYLSLSNTNRFCTLCRNQNAPKQRVFLSSSKSGWNPLNGTTLCSC